MHPKLTRAATVVCVAASLLAAPFASADKSEEVDAAYKRLADFLKAQPAMSVDLTVEYTLSVGDQSEWSVTEYSLAFVRPNRLALRVKDPRLEAQFFLDGTNVITFLPPANQYTVEPARTSPPELVMRSSVGPVADAMVIFAQVIAENPFDSPLKNALNTTHGGDAEVAGELYEKVNIDLSAVSWDAWISKTDTPTLLRVIPKLPVVEHEFAKNTGSHVELDVVMDFENWSFDRATVEKLLEFDAAATAEHVAQFTPPTPDGPDGLLGKPAPAFELSALDGSIVKLADNAGDKIVVLDFWATWCGPCRTAMPIIEKVTGELADQGVQLYAVNLEEGPAEIENFLKENGIDVTVLLDKDSGVAASYMVDGIPQTVIIDKAGVVQAVHVGVSPDLEQTLRTELTRLIQGESLVGTD